MNMNPTNNIRIAFFAGSMKYGVDGVTRVLYKVSEKLLQRNVDHIFFSAIIPPKSEQPVPMYKVPSVVVPFYPEYRYPLAADFKVSAVLKKFRPHILCVNSPCSLGWAAIYYANRHRLPVVAYYHTHFVSYAAYYKVNVLTDLGWGYMKMFYNAVHKTFIPTEPILEELAQHKIRNLSLLPHGVDTDVFSPKYFSETWKEKIGAKGKTVLLYVGRLVWEKDLATLAAAYSILKKQSDQFVLVLVGDGPIKKDLALLMPDAIFLGFQSGTDLSTCFASSDIFVFPSTTETFGMVTLEAMASRLVPVCANAGGASGIIRHGETGFLAQPHNAEDFARHCFDLVRSPERRSIIAENAYGYAHTQNWDAIIDRMLMEYAGVIEAKQRKKKKMRG